MEEPVDVPYVTKRCLQLGAWLRPFGKNIYCMVPYIIDEEEELKVVTSAMVTLAEELGQQAKK
jgi:adenosylmethionine---8-amino-7-oxononanoate aminotransferase